MEADRWQAGQLDQAGGAPRYPIGVQRIGLSGARLPVDPTTGRPGGAPWPAP